MRCQQKTYEEMVRMMTKRVVTTQIFSILSAEKLWSNQLAPGIVAFAKDAKTGGTGTAKDVIRVSMDHQFLVTSATLKSMLLGDAIAVGDKILFVMIRVQCT
mmetsp:Transcript_20436/g.30310  ORF Transcript_20436/g.30310 Transcript_20436/m.30310 type:complete len:102 (-) Transcript_20436:171-476(-)